MLLGCIADDLTGATDLALMLSRGGCRTVQTIGTPTGTPPDADAVVVALKSRTIPPKEAVAQSLEALRWLQAGGARQFFFKYCSTFDSTPEGNIGPVADALLDALGLDFTIACPAFPTNKRTVYQGHLFVGPVLLSDSGMRTHPLTPMTNPNLVTVLAEQTPHRVGLVAFPEVDAGPDALKAALHRLKEAGARYAIVDAVTDKHLLAIGTAVSDVPLVTGGSGVAMGLPGNFRRQGLLPTRVEIAQLPSIQGHAAILSGSCSDATLAQIEAFRARHPAYAIDAAEAAAGNDVIRGALDWALPRLGQGPTLIYASAPATSVAEIQARFGREHAGASIETALARIAQELVARGVRRLVVAGGETSGAVVKALGHRTLAIGPEIDPGVPWTLGLEAPQLLLALKSGNFGGPDFFTKAFEVLQ